MQHELSVLENELWALARATAFPPTPPLAEAVRRRLAEAGASSVPRRAGVWSMAALAVAAAIVFLAALVATAAPAREAVADLFHRIHIFETTELPAGISQSIQGREITLSQVPEGLGAAPQLPAYPPGIAPERILLQDFGQVKAVAYFLHDRDGTPFVLFETNGLVNKGIAPGNATADRVPDLGNEAYWLEGWRVVSYEDVRGRPVANSARATNLNTLVWAQNRLVFRIEGGLSRSEAVRIAQSLASR